MNGLTNRPSTNLHQVYGYSQDIHKRSAADAWIFLGKGGFNYAGIAHPEYFNRQYFAQSQYPSGLSASQRQNDWYGASIVPSINGTDGQNLLLSWTSQIVGGGLANGIYEIQFAVIEFDDMPADPDTGSSGYPTPSSSNNPAHAKNVPNAVASVLHIVEHGGAGNGVPGHFFTCGCWCRCWYGSSQGRWRC